MSITAATLRHVASLRAEIDDHVDNSIRDLTRAWVEAWNTLSAEWARAIEDVLAIAGDRWPNQRQLLEVERVRAALDHSAAQLTQLATYTGVRVVQASRDVTSATAAWEARIIASQFPSAVGPTQLIRTGLPQTVLDLIVERTTQQIESAANPLAPNAVAAMRRELVRGVALGTNPRQTAARMLRRTEGGFNGGLSRALNIARTETLDAQRTAAQQYELAHRDALAGWVWTCRLDSRSCPSCWAMHGTEHPLIEPGPIDHHQGRCARVPKTKTWAELGIAMKEPESVLGDAETRFWSLPREKQLEIMGPSRLKALQDGTITWNELSVQVTNTGWRDSRVPISVRQLDRYQQVRTA